MKDVERKVLAESLMQQINARRDEYQRVVGQQLPQHVFVSPQERVDELVITCIAACLYVIIMAFSLYSAAVMSGIPVVALALFSVLVVAFGVFLAVYWLRPYVLSLRSTQGGKVRMVGWSESDIRYLQSTLETTDDIIARYAEGQTKIEVITP